MTNEEQLADIAQTLTDVRLAMATMHGEVIGLVKAVSTEASRSEQFRMDHEQRLRELERIGTLIDSVRTDVEQRLRGVERRTWALPSAATVIAVIGLLLAIYDRMH